jgi:predicted enzyme related to lactoylglutathione lyase
VREAGDVAESRDVARNAARLGLALGPLELVGTDHSKAHVGTLSMSFAATAGLSREGRNTEKGEPMSSKLHITEVGRVAIPAADQDRALAFYVDTLGFEKRVDETFADGQMRWIEVAPKGAPTAIALTPPMEGGPTSVDSGIIISTDDIEADHAALKDAGVDVDPEIARWGAPVPPMFRLRDPSGNALSIVEPLE